MPVINITMKKADESQKKQLIHKLTQEAVAITKISREHFTVFVHELANENIGVGGKTLNEIYSNE